MGCSKLVNISSGGEVCCAPSPSYLLDGMSPSISTESNDWASQLVTVQKIDSIPGRITFPHVLLTFIFDTPVSVSSIEVELFNCPEWNIGAPYIFVHANDEVKLSVDERAIGSSSVNQSSCDSQTVGVTIQETSFHLNWHILITFDLHPAIEWVHIAEVRFLGVTDNGSHQPVPHKLSICPSLSSPSYTTVFQQPSTIVASPSLAHSESNTYRSTSTTSHPLPDPASLITLPIEPSNTPHSPMSESPTEKQRSHTFLITAIVLLLIVVLALVSVLGFVVYRARRRRNYKVKTNEKSSCDESALEVRNPMYSVREPQIQKHDGIYSEIDGSYSKAKKTKETRITTTSGEEFIGTYAEISTIDGKEDDTNSAANSIIGEPTYDLPDRPKKLNKSNEQRSDAEANAVVQDDVVPQVYSQVELRQVPPVPTKSSDLLEYLDTESAVNTGVHSEPINPLDFTRNRLEGSENEPMFLPPIYTVVSLLPESYQDPAEVASENIIEKRKLGTGEVVLAETKGLSLKQMQLSKTDEKKDTSFIVSVKKLAHNPSESQREAFEEEVRFMSQIKHPNVLRLLGVCHLHPAFIMMEYTEQGDLNQFLQQFSEIVATASSETQVTPSEMVYMASQIASGMQYLANLKFVHRDLSTRSCFVGARGSIKVGSVGVNTDLYQSSYYQIRGNRMMPIRWMATECFSGKYSEKSDVWAFGVTMWELFTLAKQLPYPHLSDEEVIHNSLKREYRQFPVKPVACPQSVYEVIEMCWAVDMRQRATFQNLNKMLQIVSLVSV